LKNQRLRARVEAFYKHADIFDCEKAHLYGYPLIPVSCMHQNYLLSKHIMDILPEIKTPIQLLQAKEDDVTSPRNSQYIYKHTGSKDKEIILFEDSYHIIIADQERDKVAEKTILFFNKYCSS
jgi:carboxylesterase